MNHRVTLVLGICLLLITPAFSGDLAEVDVPITRIVLFSSGVGYFERTADLDGPSAATLNFKVDQINDVLKSMIVMDEAEDAMVSVNYATLEPTARALQSFAIDLSANPTLPELLSQLRGAEIGVTTPEYVEGKILGVEAKVEMVTTNGSTTMLESFVLNLVTDDGIQAVEMDDVQNVELLDEELAEELDKALAILLASRDTTRKPVTVKFEGTGAREVRLAYISQTPVWKTSYRLDLSEEDARMQGWAIVENTSDADWEDVSLSLVSGQPISFIQDLYTPLYATRPVIQPELMANLHPQAYDAGMVYPEEWTELSRRRLDALKTDKDRFLDASKVVHVQDFAAPRLNLSVRGSSSVAQGTATFSTVGMQVADETTAVAELFRFDIGKPISLERKTSSMLPLVDRTISAEKVSIYNAGVMTDHPLNGAYLTNDTNLKLLGGPITVFDGGMYAGDSVIRHFAENEKRLISYAVDLNVNVVRDGGSESEVTAFKIVQGAIIMTHKTIQTATFNFANSATTDKTIIVEYPRMRDWQLVTPTEIEETTDSLYRFRMALAAEANETFEVKLQRVNDQHIGILRCNDATLLSYSERGDISPEVRDTLLAVIAKRQVVMTLQKELNELQVQKNEVTAAKLEVRKDLASVGAESQLGQRCMTKLSGYMDQLDQLEIDIRAKREEVAAAEKAFADHISELSVD
jgi:hypothetical protein